MRPYSPVIRALTTQPPQSPSQEQSGAAQQVRLLVGKVTAGRKLLPISEPRRILSPSSTASAKRGATAAAPPDAPEIAKPDAPDVLICHQEYGEYVEIVADVGAHRTPVKHG
jgi:hypothetical protein